MSGYTRKALLAVGVMGVLALLAGVASAGGKGGGKPKPPPEPTPGLSYSIVELPVPEGFVSSRALGVNDLGHVVGYVESAPNWPHAALWESPGAQAKVLGAGLFGSIANRINDLGQVAGGYWLDDGKPLHPAVWIPDGQGGYQMTDLGFGASNFGATDINNAGWVVGFNQWAQETTGVGFAIVPTTDETGKPVWFLDKNGDGVNDLAYPVQVSPSATWYLDVRAINDQGWVTGTYAWPDWRYNPTFVIIPDFSLPNPWWQDEDQDGFNDLAIILPVDRNDYSEDIDLNNQGQIVGEFGLICQITVADDGTLTTALTTLPPPARDYVWGWCGGVNDAGQVIGVGWRSKPNKDPDPFLYVPGEGTVFLESLVPDLAPFADLGALGGHGAAGIVVRINDAGQIAGTGTTPDGTRAFLATPAGN